jgi:hypothetical protein
MEMEKFANQIQKANRNDRNKAMIAFVVFVFFDFVLSGLAQYNDILFLVMWQCILVITALEVGRYQWNRYLYYYEGEEVIGIRESLCDVMRLQAFPVEKYFSYVSKKMYLTSIFLGVVTFLMGLFNATHIEGIDFEWDRFAITLGFGVICVLSPYIVGLGKKKFWIYQSKMGSKGKLNMMLKVGRVLFAFVEYLFAIVVSVLGIIFMWGITSAFLAPPIDETRVVLRSQQSFFGLILVFIGVLAALWALFNYSKKKLSKVMGIIASALFFISILMLVAEAYIYTEFSNEQITVRQLWNEKTYQLEEVNNFIIYDENEMIQMKLILEDGQTAKISGSSLSYSKLYEQTYFSEYNFIADYIISLREAGATGQIKDVEQLRKNVVDLDPEIQNGLEKIIEEMEY